MTEQEQAVRAVTTLLADLRVMQALLVECDSLLSLIYYREGARVTNQTRQDIDELLKNIRPITRLLLSGRGQGA